MKLDVMRLINLVILLVFVPVFSVSAQFSKVIVDKNGTGDYLTIQEGIDNAADGDTVYIMSGNYIENIVITNRELVIMGDSLVNNHNVGFSTVVDGELNGGVFKVTSSDLEIFNIKIQRGYSERGGGIDIDNNSILLIDNCSIEKNFSGRGGGVSSWSNEKIVIKNSILSQNETNGGGGVFDQSSKSVQIINSLIHSNKVNDIDGGGIEFNQTDDAIVLNSTISRNSIPQGRYGSGIVFWGSVFDSLYVINSIIAGNSNANGDSTLQIHTSGGKKVFFNSFVRKDTYLNNGLVNNGNNLIDNVFLIKDPFTTDTSLFEIGVNSEAAGIGKEKIVALGRTFQTSDSDVFGKERYINRIDAGAYQVSEDNYPNDDRIIVTKPDYEKLGDFTSIQNAVDYASEGDTIIVYPGTYQEHVILTKKITLLSAKTTFQDISEETIVDGTGTGRPLTFQNGGYLDGFKIVNGYAYDSGAISNESTDTLTIINSSFESNIAINDGHVIKFNTPVIIKKSTFISNGDNGGTVIYAELDAYMESLEFYNNLSEYDLGAFGVGSGKLTVLNSIFNSLNKSIAIDNTETIVENSIIKTLAEGDHAIQVSSNNFKINNSTLINGKQGVIGINRESGIYEINNSIVYGERGIFTGYGFANIIVNNTILSGDFMFDNEGAKFTTTLDTNDVRINTNPLFLDLESEDFRLSDYSIGLGFGDPNSKSNLDILGNPRPNPLGSNPDIGAFENPLAVPSDLPAPIEITASDNEFSIEFTWTYNDTLAPIIDHFEIYKGDSLGSISLLDTTSAYTFTDNDVVPGNDYSYMIRMVSSDERFSLYSDTLTITVEDQAPSTPMSFAGKLSGVKEITLMWEPNKESDIQFYELSKQSGGESFSVLDSLTEVSFVDSIGLDELTRYSYSLTAVDNGGNKSEPIFISQRTGDETRPVMPIGLVAEASPGQVDLAWLANNEADLWKYLIYRGTDSTQVALIDSIDSNVTNYTDLAVVNAKTYYYRISALDSVNGNPEMSFDPALESELSTEVKALPPDLEGPGKPEIISTSSFNKTVNFSWNPLDAGDLDFYHVYRGTSESILNIIDSVFTTSYQDMTVVNGITYYYAVNGVDTVGNEGERSNIISATPTNALPRVSTYSSLVFNNIESPTFEYNAVANASDADGSIDSTFWFVNGVLSSTTANPTLELEQGTSELTLRVMDNDGGTDEKSFKVHVNSGYRLFEDGMSDGAGISMIGTDYVFIPIQGGTMQILDGGFQDRNTLSVGGEIKNVSSIAQDTTVYLASSDKVVYTFNRLGIPIWDTPLGGELEATPTIDVSRDLVYVGVSNNNLFAINRATGTVVWSNRLDSPISQPGVIIEDKYLLVITTGGTVYYFDLDGEVSSQVLAPKGILSIGENIVSAPALDAAGYLYLASTTGTIRKFEFRDDLPSKGQVIWEVNTQSEFYTSPVIGYDGTVYVGGADSTLYALNGQNSSLKWSKKLGAAISTTATINEYGVLYIGDSDGTIYAMSDTGEPIWYYETGSEIGNATAYADGHLYFATADGELLKVYDGWRYEGIQGKTTWVSKAPQWGTYQGNFRRSGNLSEASVINSVEPLEELPQDYALSQNYPNPFNPSTKINYSLPEATRVSLDIFNMLGQKVATLVDTHQPAGIHTASFDASQLSSGVYLYKLTTPGFIQTKKMLLVK